MAKEEGEIDKIFHELVKIKGPQHGFYLDKLRPEQVDALSPLTLKALATEKLEEILDHMFDQFLEHYTGVAL